VAEFLSYSHLTLEHFRGKYVDNLVQFATSTKTTNMKKLTATLMAVTLAVSVFAGEYKEISVKEARTLVDSKKAVFLDANGTESFKKGRIPGALNFEDVKSQLASKLPADKNALIVAYCGNPKCKAYQEAAKAASDLGYKNIRHMSAGIAGWKEAGQPIEK
jgi:rhodanese-related sulfurtransferase